jgi:hypothetical protein
MRIEPTGRARFVAAFEHIDPNGATRNTARPDSTSADAMAARSPSTGIRR